MKFDFIKSLIALGISALIAYGFYTICDYDGLRWLLTIASGVILAILGVFAVGVTPKAERTAVVMQIFSAVVFAVMTVMNFVFSFFDFNKPLFIILNGICLLLYALIAVSMYRKQQ